MRRIFAIWAVCLCWGILNAAPSGPFNATLLEQLKNDYQKGDKDVTQYIELQEKVAEKYIKMTPLSVTAKKKLPPSKDPRDYMTLSPYWWPDSTKTDGLPYIRKDGSKGYEHKAKLTILKEAARTLNYLTENNLLQYADLEKKVEDIHSSYARTGSELKNVEAKLREVQPLIKNISNYQRLKPVNEAYQKAKDKTAFRAKHEAELVIFEAAKSTLLAVQGEYEKL